MAEKDPWAVVSQEPAARAGADDWSVVEEAPATYPGTNEVVREPPGLGQYLRNRLQAGVITPVAGAAKYVADVLAPDISSLSPNVQALASAVFPQRRAGDVLAREAQIAQDVAADYRNVGAGQRPTSIVEALTQPENTARYYGGIAAESAPNILAALATRNPAAANIVASGGTAAQTYGDLRQDPRVNVGQALQESTIAGITEGAGGKPAFEAAMSGLPLGRRILQTVPVEAIGEFGSETAQTATPSLTGREDVPILEIIRAGIDAALVGTGTGTVEAVAGGGRPAPAAAPIIEPVVTNTPWAVVSEEPAPAPAAMPAQPAVAEGAGTPMAAPAGVAPLAPELDIDAILASLPQNVIDQAAALVGGQPAAPAAPTEGVLPNVPPPGALPEQPVTVPATPAGVAAAVAAPAEVKVAAEGGIPAQAGAQEAPGQEVAGQEGRQEEGPVTYTAADFLPGMGQEVGWAQRGGELQRERREGDDSIENFAGRATGDVTGRTTWVAKADPSGQESRLWRSRPDRSLNEGQAQTALDKAARGEKLRPIEQRFVDHATSLAEEYAEIANRESQAYREELEQFTEADLVAQRQAAREEFGELADADADEALAIDDLVHRAYSAGAEPEAILDTTFDGTPAEQARALWRIVAELESQANAPVAEATERGGAVSPGPSESREAATARAQAGLFGAPTAREEVDAAARQRDAERDGRTGTGRTDMAAGAGDLFAGRRPAQATLESVDDDYRMQHRAPNRENGAPLDDVTGNGIYPDDVYSRNGPRFYAAHPDFDAAAFRILNSYRGNPDAPVTIYRAVPAGVDTIRQGDWVAIVKGYAQDHAEGMDDWHIISKQVRASDIFTNGDSVQEWGYDPETESLEEVASPRDRLMARRAEREAERAAIPARAPSPLQPTEEDAEASRAGGNADADANGLRAEVDKVLGRAGASVVYLRGIEGLPESQRRGVQQRSEQRGGKGRTAGLYDPNTKTVYLFTDVLTKPDRAAFVAAHEIAGHAGLRALLGDKLDHALGIARQNPTVKAVADAIATERKLRGDQTLLATEEALAELAAAVRTGNYSEIETRYGVPVPEGVRANVKAAIGNFLKRLRAMIDDIFGRHVFTDEDVRELLEAAWSAANDGPTLGDARGGMAVESTQESFPENGTFTAKLRDGTPVVVKNKQGSDGYADVEVNTESGEWLGHLMYGTRESGAGQPRIAPRVFVQEDSRRRGVATLMYRVANGSGGKLPELGASNADRSEGGQALRKALRDRAILESVEDMTAKKTAAEAAKLPDDATGRSIITGGQLVPFLAAAKQAGADLTDVGAALRNPDAGDRARDLVKAIDAILPSMREPVAAAEPPAPKAEPKPPRPSTGTKNAVTDAERAAAGRDPILRDAVQTNADTLAEAMRTIKEDPDAGPETVEKLVRSGPGGISLADEAVLLVHKTDLRNRRDAAAAKLANPNASEEAKEVARREWESLEAQIATIDEAAVASGREWGRLGQFRQRMLRDDFTFEALERKERARLERPLTPAESKTVKAMADRIAEAQARADAAESQLANAASVSTYDDLVKKMASAMGGKRRPTLERLKQAANESRAALASLESVPSRKGQSGATINPVAFYHLARIGAYHVANGAATFSDWVGKMRADIGDAVDTFRDALPEIFRASKVQADKPLRAGATVAEVLAKIDRANLTPKDVRQLVEAHVGEGMRGEAKVMAAVAEDLGIEVDQARKLFVQTNPRTPQTLSEAKQELRDLRQLVRLGEEIKRLQEGLPRNRANQKVEVSGEVQAKRDELDALRKKLRLGRSEMRQAQKDAETAPVDPEERYQINRGRDIARRIAQLQKRITAGDFAATPRVPKPLNAANDRAQFELTKAKQDFLRHQFEANLAARTPIQKLFGGVKDTLNLARAMMTSLDLSGVLRQGGFITYGHPVRAAKSLVPMLKSFASAEAEHKVNREIENRANAPLYRKYGLELTGIGSGPLSQIEEAYASRWLDRLPRAVGGGLVRGSGRAYTTFLNKLRADSFDAMVASLSKTGTPTPAEGKAIANYINVATGRGKIGAKANAGEALNTIFFAPRLVASRFQLLAGQPLYGGSNRTRGMIAQEYARFLAGVGVVTALAAMALGDDEEEPKDNLKLIGTDPRSANFGKVRFGNTYLDPLAGLAQATTLLARLTTGETVTQKGDVRPLRANYTLNQLQRALGADIEEHELTDEGGLPFGANSAADVIGRFLRTKLAPVPGAVVNTLAGENLIGEPVTPAEAARDLVIPMSIGNVREVMEDQGITKGTAITLLGLLGMGVQYRKPKEEDEEEEK